ALNLLRVGQDAAALALLYALDDGTGQLDILPSDEIDLLGKIAGSRTGAAAAADNQDRLADLDLIAGRERNLGDGLIVDEGAVGAADVAQEIAFSVSVLDNQLGMAAGDFGIVEADAVNGIPAYADRGAGQLELLALVGTLDDDQFEALPTFH